MTGAADSPSDPKYSRIRGFLMQLQRSGERRLRGTLVRANEHNLVAQPWARRRRPRSRSADAPEAVAAAAGEWE
jgi:hypothetical protein